MRFNFPYNQVLDNSYIKNNVIYNWTKDHILPIVFIIGGIIDETTDLLVQLLSEVNAPAWIGTLLRIIIISIGAFKLYYTNSSNVITKQK